MKVKISDYKKDGDTRDVEIAFSQDDLIDLRSTLSLIIAPALREFKAMTKSYPNNLTSEEWDDALEDMIFAFERISKCELSAAEESKIQLGLNLFNIFFLDLWS